MNVIYAGQRQSSCGLASIASFVFNIFPQLSNNQKAEFHYETKDVCLVDIQFCNFLRVLFSFLGEFSVATALPFIYTVDFQQ